MINKYIFTHLKFLTSIMDLTSEYRHVSILVGCPCCAITPCPRIEIKIPNNYLE